MAIAPYTCTDADMDGLSMASGEIQRVSPTTQDSSPSTEPDTTKVEKVEHTTPDFILSSQYDEAVIKTPPAVHETKPLNRLLVTFVYFESPTARVNLAYFVKHGLHDAADFIFVFNGETNATSFLPKKDNVRIVRRDNTCYDLGATGEVLRTNELWKKYDRFIMMNASLRGPFLPQWTGDCWSDLFLNKITDQVKLVGITANCIPRFHVQSMIWATDRVGVELLLDPSKIPGAAVADRYGNASDPIGLSACYNEYRKAIHSEIGSTAIITTAGYKVDVMMTSFYGVARGDPETYCPNVPRKNKDDTLRQGDYFGSTIHPFETVFIKTNRNIDPVGIENLSRWMAGGGYTSYGKYLDERRADGMFSSYHQKPSAAPRWAQPPNLKHPARFRYRTIFVALGLTWLCLFWLWGARRGLFRFGGRTGMPSASWRTNTSQLVPPRIWQIMLPKDAPRASEDAVIDPESLRNSASWIAANPGYSYTLVGEKAGMEFVREHFAAVPRIVEAYANMPNIGMKSDLLRYLLLGIEGGVYTDVDTVALRPIDDWIPAGLRERVRLVVGVEFDRREGGVWPDKTHWVQFCQWTIAAAPGHPVFRRMAARAVAALEGLEAAQGVPLGEVRLMTVDVANVTGVAAWTETVFGMLREYDETLRDVRMLSGMTEPRLVGDVLVLPIDGFGMGQPHSGSSNGRPPEAALMRHLFHGSWMTD
ncbi:hypothetical protein CkaCkLH20_09734 [Colletotrichum karsti]|uniref:Initiation-specific alpha-1,6-mannosyltransferase n=1 Tax=Colletotrichum karsti TaxID=1095194 RepID=A0A9P6I2M2_9PEZI|nr:uncharacterized protein CkaCkLH20_09734 [Colletotrichum karsti]KAF9872871.1 hypothetical protein CkaCkLH20_09734 [Colletotrichum karsti]